VIFRLVFVLAALVAPFKRVGLTALPFEV